MTWNVASARDEISLHKWSGGTAHLRTLRGSIGCKKFVLLAATLLFHSCFFTQFKPGLGKLVQYKSHLQKTKNTSKPQNQFVVSLMHSNCQYLVFVWFSSPRKSGNYAVKAVRINSPKSSFFRVARWYDFTNFITEKKNHSNMLCYTHKWFIHWYFNFWYLLSGTCRQQLSVEWHWLTFFWDRFSCISVSFISTADKFVKNG